MDMNNLTEKICGLKKKLNAVILAHNYQLGEVQDIADFTGDSLELSFKAAESKCDIIVFCGVTFMAETASILAPGKTVLLPVLAAGCPMADMADAKTLEEMKKKHPGALVVTYVVYAGQNNKNPCQHVVLYVVYAGQNSKNPCQHWSK